MILPIARRLLLILAFAPALAAAQLPAGVKAGPTVEGVTQYTLANGLEVLLFPDDSKPTTTVNVTYKVGSRHENYGETGMAHLLEHMLFKGTPSVENVWQELGRRGMERRTARRSTTAPTTSRPSRRPTRTSTGRSSSRPSG